MRTVSAAWARSGVGPAPPMPIRASVMRPALSVRSAASAFRLVAFVPDRVDGPPAGEPDPLRLRQLEDLVALRVEASRRRGAVTSCEGRIYATFPVVEDRPPGEATALVREIAGQATRQLRVELRAAVSGEITSADRLVEARRDVDRLLTLPLLDESRRVVAFEDSIADAVLSELTEIVLDRPRLLQGGVAGMVVSDRDCGTEYLPSLRAFFEAGGDLTAAARTLYVHRNTLKYRLTRIRDVFGVDVEIPTQRLVAELQVAVFTGHPELHRRLDATAPEQD
ncbi:PucR family transcriptional regulator [Amycolatopsis sp. NPDC001319]|uniref:PucR family transcriptional regulator n=1 Tax=unclassified Amycolatopsis TaxID=2618356 RepID=UPI00369D91C2